MQDGGVGHFMKLFHKIPIIFEIWLPLVFLFSGLQKCEGEGCWNLKETSLTSTSCTEYQEHSECSCTEYPDMEEFSTNPTFQFHFKWVCVGDNHSSYLHIASKGKFCSNTTRVAKCHIYGRYIYIGRLW